MLVASQKELKVLSPLVAAILSVLRSIPKGIESMSAQAQVEFTGVSSIPKGIESGEL